MGGYDPIFARESAKLQRPGDLTAPFETPFGVHVVQLERIEPEIRRSDAEIATEIERELVQRRVQRLQSEAIARQRARAPVTIEPTAQADMERLIQQMFGELAP